MKKKGITPMHPPKASGHKGFAPNPNMSGGGKGKGKGSKSSGGKDSGTCKAL